MSNQSNVSFTPEQKIILFSLSLVALLVLAVGGTIITLLVVQDRSEELTETQPTQTPYVIVQTPSPSPTWTAGPSRRITGFAIDPGSDCTPAANPRDHQYTALGCAFKDRRTYHYYLSGTLVTSPTITFDARWRGLTKEEHIHAYRVYLTRQASYDQALNSDDPVGFILDKIKDIQDKSRATFQASTPVPTDHPDYFSDSLSRSLSNAEFTRDDAQEEFDHLSTHVPILATTYATPPYDW